MIFGMTLRRVPPYDSVRIPWDPRELIQKATLSMNAMEMILAAQMRAVKVCIGREGRGGRGGRGQGRRREGMKEMKEDREQEVVS